MTFRKPLKKVAEKRDGLFGGQEVYFDEFVIALEEILNQSVRIREQE